VKLVVADTGPLNYLIQIGHVSVLRLLTDRVVLPSLVAEELCAEGAPVVVRDWAAALPDWVAVLNATFAQIQPEISRADGEGIALALELDAVLLMDDRRARAAARRRGVVTIGTLGILEVAAAKELISLPEAIGHLRNTNMFMAESLLADALARDRRRKGDAG